MIPPQCEVQLLSPEHAPMPVAPPAIGDSIADMLAARGIHYHPLFTFKELRPESRARSSPPPAARRGSTC
jgi:hypothetical protein